jgi:hypothetical protein
MAQPVQDQITTHETDLRERTVEIRVNYRGVHVPQDVTGSRIIAAAGLPADFRLFRIDGHNEISIAGDELVHVHEHERFVACPTLDPAFVTNQAHTAQIETVRDAFAGHEITVEEPGDGTTVITVGNVDVGAGWNVSELDLSVKLQVTFPSSPPYPFYGPPGMARVDGRALPQIQPHVQVDGASRTQISLNKPFDPAVETLAGRLVAVIDWLRSPR